MLSKWFVLEKSLVTQEQIIKYKEKYSGIPLHGTALKGGLMWGDEKVALFIMEGLSDSFRLYSAENIPDNSYFIFTNPWVPYSRDHLKKQIAFFQEVTNNRFPKDRLIHLANDLDSLNLALDLELKHSIFCNQNAWINFDTFKIIRSQSYKKFSLALNCRPENLKRPYLAEGINGLLVIKGTNHNPSDYYDLSKLNPKYINTSRITPTEVNDLLNQSLVGGIFSEAEGACFASSEYLLAGLPVISTPSRGGRDYWFNSENSIICEPTSSSVKDALNVAIDRLKSGGFDPANIREQHIAKSIHLREKFIELVQKIFDIQESTANAQQVVPAYYNNGGFFKKSKYPYYS